MGFLCAGPGKQNNKQLRSDLESGTLAMLDHFRVIDAIDT